ncbi:cellulose biosynthesis protein BcsO [Lelliottia sp. JS-SCA-14]|uniref:cellulose biosynthesis protein BcsO n=1 Tax=Lelliottia sp. JS-SCA-14 TaxID=3110110 RepID=UPI002D77F4E1|nr:cellulose biosynthesis protein BcsO [Lelliottia sp. JS-SCA-14]
MNHYDDLQRFKDKTRNQALDFKDFSVQNQASDQGSWAILNQLTPQTETQAFAQGGHVSVAAPQPVSAETFTLAEAAPVAEIVTADVVPAHAPSIFQGVAEQLATQPETPSAPIPAPAPIRAAAPVPVQAPTDVNFSRLFAPAASTPKPAAEKNQPLNSLLERIASCR